jgi:hypothetical protein
VLFAKGIASSNDLGAIAKATQEACADAGSGRPLGRESDRAPRAERRDRLVAEALAPQEAP